MAERSAAALHWLVAPLVLWGLTRLFPPTGTRRKASTAIRTAYRLWHEHTRKCTDGCKNVHKALDGCEGGRELWAAYRRAYAGGPR
ncbi:hypothetical protein [Streptomyces sp. NPDC000878]